MSGNHQWVRVTRQDKCKICLKPDWCTYCPSLALAHCLRVESDRPCKSSLGGWLHGIGDTTKFRPLPIKPERPPPSIDAAALMKSYSTETWDNMVAELSESLGVSLASLIALGVAWSVGHEAWAWPMRSSNGDVVGIRLRSNDGHKWAVRGSHAGLFYAEGDDHRVFVLEGPTDTAAAMTIGLNAIGRPACLGSELEVDRLLKRKRARECVIVSDNDEPGYRGAEKLQAALSIPSVIWVPCSKDMRQFVGHGGTPELIDASIKSLVWHQPKRK